MKRIIACLVMLLMFNSAAWSAHCSHGHHGHSCHHGGHYSHSSSSGNSVYLISKDYKKQEEKFANCDKHYMVVETFTNYYSDGTRRIFTNCTIYNSDGTVLEADCNSVKHIIFSNNHYFIIRKGRIYSLINSAGDVITKRNYTFMDELAQNRLLVRYEKRYGIIDLNEKIIASIKYQKFQRCGNKIYLTKLNGYYGLLDVNGNVLVENDCEKIKPLYDTIVLKRYGKYGLTNLDGKVMISPSKDKIKKLGEYIIVKDGDKYKVLSSDGKEINGLSYRKIKLKRNTLYGITDDKSTVKIDKI